MDADNHENLSISATSHEDATLNEAVPAATNSDAYTVGGFETSDLHLDDQTPGPIQSSQTNTTIIENVLASNCVVFEPRSSSNGPSSDFPLPMVSPSILPSIPMDEYLPVTDIPTQMTGNATLCFLHTFDEVYTEGNPEIEDALLHLPNSSLDAVSPLSFIDGGSINPSFLHFDAHRNLQGTAIVLQTCAVHLALVYFVFANVTRNRT